MGKVLSTIKHPFRNFNLENRAHKVISQSKPIPAPRHAKDELDVKRIQEKYPDIFEQSLRKDEQLDQRLKDIYVVSHDPAPELKKSENPNRPLPQDRSQPAPFLFGHKEPNNIPLGKTVLRDALMFISQHQGDPKFYTAKKIAKDYKIPEEIVENILKYYRVFEIYIPESSSDPKAKFAGPSTPKTYITQDITKLLPPPNFNKKDET